MAQDRDDGREGRAGLGGGMGGTTGGTLGGARREAMGEGAGEGDAPKLSAAEIDDRAPNPVRDDAVARVTPDQLQANPRSDDGPAGAAGGTLSGG